MPNRSAAGRFGPLPDEIVAQIARFLDPSAFFYFCQTCARIRTILYTPSTIFGIILDYGMDPEVTVFVDDISRVLCRLIEENDGGGGVELLDGTNAGNGVHRNGIDGNFGIFSSNLGSNVGSSASASSEFSAFSAFSQVSATSATSATPVSATSTEISASSALLRHLSHNYHFNTYHLFLNPHVWRPRWKIYMFLVYYCMYPAVPRTCDLLRPRSAPPVLEFAAQRFAYLLRATLRLRHISVSNIPLIPSASDTNPNHMLLRHIAIGTLHGTSADKSRVIRGCLDNSDPRHPITRFAVLRPSHRDASGFPKVEAAFRFPGAFDVACAANNCDVFAFAGNHGHVHVVRLTDKSLESTTETVFSKPFPSKFRYLALSPDGTVLFAHAARLGGFSLVDLRSGAEMELPHYQLDLRMRLSADGRVLQLARPGETLLYGVAQSGDKLDELEFGRRSQRRKRKRGCGVGGAADMWRYYATLVATSQSTYVGHSGCVPLAVENVYLCGVAGRSGTDLGLVAFGEDGEEASLVALLGFPGFGAQQAVPMASPKLVAQLPCTVPGLRSRIVAQLRATEGETVWGVRETEAEAEAEEAAEAEAENGAVLRINCATRHISLNGMTAVSSDGRLLAVWRTPEELRLYVFCGAVLARAVDDWKLGIRTGGAAAYPSRIVALAPAAWLRELHARLGAAPTPDSDCYMYFDGSAVCISDLATHMVRIEVAEPA